MNTNAHCTRVPLLSLERAWRMSEHQRRQLTNLYCDILAHPLATRADLHRARRSLETLERGESLWLLAQDV